MSAGRRALTTLGLGLSLVALASCDVVRTPAAGETAAGGLVRTVSTDVANAKAASDAVAPFVIPDEATIPSGPLGMSIRRGRALVTHTKDSLPRLVGNGLRCASCHLDAGTRRDVMPWVGVYARFPQYRSRSGAVIDLEERIGDCFERSLNGRAPAYDSRAMRDIVAYMAWLSREVPVGRPVEGQGMPTLVPLTPIIAAGETVYRARCARCHGQNGEGGAAAGATPVWGSQSYNIGAGMARLRTAAAFIRVAMPHDSAGVLTPQEAFDVAAYINGRPRPDFAAKVNDWPFGDPPPDVAYRVRSVGRGR